MRLEDAAAEAGLPIVTAKSLEERGLVSPDPKTGAYDPWRVAQFAVVRRAMELGVTDEAVATLLGFLNGQAAACDALEDAAYARQAEIECKLTELEETKRSYEELKGAA